MAKKVDPIKAKQAKQKKIAIGGAVLLVLLMAVEVPSTMKRMHGGSGGADWRTQVAEQNAAAAPAAPTAPGATALAAPSLAGGNGVDPTASSGGSGLASETAPTAGLGQVSSFGRFASKDPFQSQAPTDPGTVTGSAPPAPPSPLNPGGGTGTGTTPGNPAATPPAPPSPAPTSAVIAVNGVKASVMTNSDFPAATPLFRLKSLTAHSVKVAIAGGSYADGAPTITLREGKPVTLQNTADGTRYTLELYPQGTPVPTSTTTTGASTPAPASTTPLPVPTQTKTTP